MAALVDGNPAVGVPHDLHPKEMFQFAEVLHLEFPGQLRLHSRNITSILASDEQMVNPNRDANVSFAVNVKAGVARLT